MRPSFSSFSGCSTKTSSSSSQTSTFSNVSSSTSISTIPISTSPIPNEFGFYRCGDSTTVLALTAKDPFPFAQSSTYKCKPSHPDLILYSGRDRPCAQLASARFEANGEPRIALGSKRNDDSSTEKVAVSYGSPPAKYQFSSHLESVGTGERFEWQPYRFWEWKSIFHSIGMTLVRVKTGTVIALYTKASWPKKKTGKMKFVDGENFGNDFQVMAVMSLLAILERESRLLGR